MITPDDGVTIPQPEKNGPTGFQKTLTGFAVLGVLGLGTCGFSLSGNRLGNAALIGLGLILTSLVGLVITAACMAIASILKATKAPDEK